jgi:hypothetical protein
MGKNMNNSFNDYMQKVANYIYMEYGDSEFNNDMTIDEKYVLKMIGETFYNNHDSPSNAANDMMQYLRDNRAWMKENIK